MKYSGVQHIILTAAVSLNIVVGITIKAILEETKPGCIARLDTDEGIKWIYMKDDFDIVNGQIYNYTDGDGQPTYKWRPCQPFSIMFQSQIAQWDDTCQDVYVAKQKQERVCEGLGNVTKFILTKDKELQISYSYKRDTHLHSILSLKCNESLHVGRLACVEESCTGYTPTLSFQSPYVCLRDKPTSLINKHPSSANSYHSPSAGSLVLIISGILLFVYFFTGVIRGSIKGRSGCDRLPNADFWLELPYLVRDGCRFGFTCRRPRPYDGRNRRRQNRRRSRGHDYRQVSYDNRTPIVDL